MESRIEREKNYTRVEKEREATNPNEIRIKYQEGKGKRNRAGVGKYLKYAMTLLEDPKEKQITIRATGKAISTALTVI